MDNGAGIVCILGGKIPCQSRAKINQVTTEKGYQVLHLQSPRLEVLQRLSCSCEVWKLGMMKVEMMDC